MNTAAGAGVVQLVLRYVLGFLINFAGTVVIARTGGPGLWGIFAISQVILSLSAFVSIGCWGYLIQKSEEPDEATIGNCYTFQTGLSLVWALTVVGFSPFAARYLASNEIVPLLAATAAGGFFYGWRFIACSHSERTLNYRISSLTELSEAAVFTVTTLMFAASGEIFKGIIIGNFLRCVVSMVLAHVMARKRVFFRFDSQLIKQVAGYGLPYIGSNVLAWLPGNAGPILAGSTLGVRELGLMQLGYRTVEYARVIVTIASRISLGFFSRNAGDSDKMHDLTKKALHLLYFPLVPGIGMLVAMSPLWVPRIYGQEWMRVTMVMIIILFPFLVMSMTYLLASLLQSRGNSRTPFMFFLGLNILYWPSVYGITPLLGYFGPPVAEWLVLASCSILLLGLKRSGIAIGIFIRYAILLLCISGLFGVVWYLLYRGFLLEGIGMCFAIVILWVVLSPVKQEVRQWFSGMYTRKLPL